jgi:hypothetical protein
MDSVLRSGERLKMGGSAQASRRAALTTAQPQTNSAEPGRPKVAARYLSDVRDGGPAAKRLCVFNRRSAGLAIGSQPAARCRLPARRPPVGRVIRRGLRRVTPEASAAHYVSLQPRGERSRWLIHCPSVKWPRAGRHCETISL